MKYLAYIIIIIFILINIQVFAQGYKSTDENEKYQLEDRIKYTNELLNTTRSEKDISLNDLALLRNKISNREVLLKTLHYEHNILLDSIFSILIKIDKSATELKMLKNEYAQMVNSAYRNSNVYQRMLYIIASEDLNQAYQRMNFYRQYASERAKHISIIEIKENEYLAAVELLNDKISENEMLLAKLNNETSKLQQEIEVKNAGVARLKKQEKEITEGQRKFQVKLRSLKEIIEKDLLTQKGKTELISKDTILMDIPISSSNDSLSYFFSSNRGRLPWPTERGVMSASFGEQQHPDLKGVLIKNNGINIITSKGSTARTIFNGEVTRVFSNPDLKNVVIIRHGDYLSVYSNLGKAFVSRGSIVKILDNIGLIADDDQGMYAELHFEIWEGKTLQDPLHWLVQHTTDNVSVTGQQNNY